MNLKYLACEKILYCIKEPLKGWRKNRFLHLQSCSRGWAWMLIKSFPHYHHPLIRSDHLNTPLTLPTFIHNKHICEKFSHTEFWVMWIPWIINSDVEQKYKCWQKCKTGFLSFWLLQGQFVRKVARLLNQQSEGGEKFEAIKLLDSVWECYTCNARHVMHAF